MELYSHCLMHKINFGGAGGGGGNATRASRLLNSFLTQLIFSTLFEMTGTQKLILQSPRRNAEQFRVAR